MAKQLSDLATDLRAGLELGMEKAAHDITLELKKRGPYWTGDFEAGWHVVVGQRLMPSPTPERDNINFKEPSHKTTSSVVVPLPQLEEGYTIYNEMEYADQAMDLVPGTDGVIRGDRDRATADKDWFEDYLLGGEANGTLAIALKQGMRLAGFKR